VTILCSEKIDRERNIDLLLQKFKNSGYDESELEIAKNKALALNREKYWKGRIATMEV
jgi:hypothetical protein